MIPRQQKSLSVQAWASATIIGLCAWWLRSSGVMAEFSEIINLISPSLAGRLAFAIPVLVVIGAAGATLARAAYKRYTQ